MLELDPSPLKASSPSSYDLIHTRSIWKTLFFFTPPQWLPLNVRSVSGKEEERVNQQLHSWCNVFLFKPHFLLSHKSFTPRASTHPAEKKCDLGDRVTDIHQIFNPSMFYNHKSISGSHLNVIYTLCQVETKWIELFVSSRWAKTKCWSQTGFFNKHQQRLLRMFPVNRIYLQNVSNLPLGPLKNWAFLAPLQDDGSFRGAADTLTPSSKSFINVWWRKILQIHPFGDSSSKTNRG